MVVCFARRDTGGAAMMGEWGRRYGHQLLVVEFVFNGASPHSDTAFLCLSCQCISWFSHAREILSTGQKMTIWMCRMPC